MRKRIAAFLKWLLNEVDPQFRDLHFIIFDGSTTHKVNHMKSTLKDNGSLVLAILCLSSAGNKVVPEVEISDPSLATVALSEDGSLATFTPTGKVGEFTFTARAGNLVATDDVSIVPSDAVTLTLTEVTAQDVAADPVAQPVVSGS